MTYDHDNEKEDLNCYFNDDSSAEEELLRVAEKLETMHHQEEEARKKVALKVEEDGNNSSNPPIGIRQYCPESILSDCSPNSSPTIPASKESNMFLEITTKHVVATSATDSAIHFDIRNEKNENRDGDRMKPILFHRDDKEERRGLQQMQAQQHILSSRKDNGEVVSNTTNRSILSQNVDEDEVVECQDSKRLQSPENRKEKRPLSRSLNRQIIATVKTTNDEKAVQNCEMNDKKSFDDDNHNGNNTDSIDDYDRTFAKKLELAEHVAEKEDQKEVIVDFTKMATTSSSNECLDRSDSISNRSEISNLSDSCTSSSTSSSSVSDNDIEAAPEILYDDKNSAVMHTDIRRSDLLRQLESQPDYVAVTTTKENYDILVLDNSSAATYSSGIAPSTNNATKRTHQLKVIGNSDSTPSGADPNSVKDYTIGKGLSKKASIVLRNPYFRKQNDIVAGVNEAEPTLTHDLKNQHPFPRVTNTKRVTNVYTNDNDNKPLSLRSEASNERIASIPTRDPIEKKREEKTIIDEQELREEPESEVSHSLYAPPVYHKGRPSPILHRFDYRNHPLHSRQKVPVDSLNSLFTSTIVNSLWAQKFDRFNHFQSVMVNTLSETDDNVVVSAPTGAGKSTIFEMALARILAVDLRAQEQQCKTPNLVSKARKIVYIAPSKALCEERYADWSRRLKSMNLGLVVALITGQDVGSEHTTQSFPDLIAAHLIVTTPEKWDSMTRRWNENFFLFASTKLLLLDEVHLLGDEGRGWCLESIVIRMKTIQRAAAALLTTPLEISTSSYTETNPDAIRSSFRIVAVSATLPNISEVAEFLQANEAYSFDDSYRPVPLTKHVNALGKVGNNEWRFWSNLSEHVPEIIKRFSHGKQCLIFCHSKKETQKVTQLLIRRNFGNRGVRIVDPPWNEPVEYMLGHGIGYHHAGMCKDERKTIEEAFLNKRIKCLAATSTLAVGVNLPAHLVIIVGTKAWRNNKKGKGYQEIEVNELLQMVGRAGRPGLDSTGVAVVLTDNCSKKRIEDLLEAGIGPAKSNLVPRLPEILNTEIALRVVTSMEETLRWLRTTFLFSCLKNSEDVVTSMQKLCNAAITHLREIGMVETSEQHSICPLAGSFIMNKHLVSFEKMKAITAFPFDASQCQILRSMSKLKSLQSFVKRNEKRELKEFHKSDLMKYKLPGVLSKFIVRDPSEKVFILLQSHISRHKYKNEMINDEQITVRDEAITFLEVAQEYCVKASKHGKLALECYKLQRSLNCSLWGETSGVFNQFEWIGSSKTASNILTFDGVRSFQDVLDFSEQKLDDIFAKIQIPNLPKNAGRIVKHTARDLCRRRLILSADVEYTKNSNIPTDLICSLKYHDPTLMMTRERGEQDLKFSLIAYTDNLKDSSLVFKENICSLSSFRIPLPPYYFQKLFVHLVGTWVGFDQTKIIDVNDTLVSSNERRFRILPNSRVANLKIHTLSSAKTKKRKRCQINISCSTNQRQIEKQYSTSASQTKKPSPITPQTKDKNSGTLSPFVTSNQQSVENFWEEYKEDCQTVQSAKLPITPGVAQPQSKKKSISISVTPTMHYPMKKVLRHRRSSNSVYMGVTSRHDLPSNSADQKHVSSITEYENSGLSGLENSCGENAADHDGLPTSETVPFVMYESVDTTLAKKSEGIKNYTWGELKRQRDKRLENGTIAYLDSTTSDQTANYSPLTSLRQGNREKIMWNQSRTKQNRAQKRAFTEKKMNPFGTFSHDPNDFERHLEQLSQQSSIIPNPLLAKMKKSSIASNRKTNRHFSTDRNRHARRVRHRYSNETPQQVLREKAFEQQSQHEKIILHQQNSLKHIPSQRPHQENYCTHQTPLPANICQHNVETFRNPCWSSGHQLKYPQYIERQSHFRHPSVPSGTTHFPITEDIRGGYPTALGGHYQPFDRLHGHSSNTLQLSREPFGEYSQQLHADPFGNSRFNLETQSQNQHLHRRNHPHHHVSDSAVDFESDFRDAFC